MRRTGDFFAHLGGWIWAHKWKSVGVLILIAVILFSVLSPKKPKTPIVFESVKEGNLKATVLATGTVTSVTDLALSFPASDILRKLSVVVGDKVKSGTILATLDNRDERAALTSAQGAVASAEAAKQKLIEGASNEEIKVAQTAVDNAQAELTQTTKEQNQLVENAHRALLSGGLAAIPVDTKTTIPAPTISGTYTSSQEGTYTIDISSTGGGGQFSISGLETGGGLVSTTAPVALGTRGLFIEFPSNFTAVSGTSWTVQIPNTQASVYAANYNAYQAAIQMRESALVSAQAVVNARQADLALKQADARPAEIAAAEADILSARGKLEAAQVAYDNTLLRAPASGTITAVDVKLGEQVTAQKPVITLEDVSNIYIEANINESDIPRVVVGQKVNVTFDAFGPEKVYDATVSSIDPSSTTVSGVVNYKVKATLADSTGVLPGMTANMTIVTGEKDTVLYIPKAAIHTDGVGSFVYVVTDQKGNKYERRAVTTGFVGDGNQVEITTGLTENDRVIVSDISTL